MMRTYFLGANTPEGFRSEYGSLQTDRRIEKLWILKGGSGCGKSTLMRLVAARAEQLGLSCEQILCSSAGRADSFTSSVKVKRRKYTSGSVFPGPGLKP